MLVLLLWLNYVNNSKVKVVAHFVLFSCNLDSIFKSRDITLPTKVCLVKVMCFPVVVYGCESWTVKKAER